MVSMLSLPPNHNPPGLPPFRYFTHFVLFFRKANEKTPEEKAAEKEKRAERERARLMR